MFLGVKSKILAIWLWVIVLVASVSLPFLNSVMSFYYVTIGNQQLSEQKDIDSALVAFSSALYWSPSDASIHHLLAQAYLKQGDLLAAKQSLLDALEFEPNSLLIQQDLAKIFEALGDFEQANRTWKRIGHNKDSFINIALLDAQAGSYDLALMWLERAKRMEPDSAVPWYYQGVLAQKQDLEDEAVAAFSQATQVDPLHRDAWYALAQIYQARNQGAQALEYLRLGADAKYGLVGKSDILFRLAILTRSVNNPTATEEAKSLLSEALEFNEFSSSLALQTHAYYNLADILLAQQNWEEAGLIYTALLNNNPQDVNAYILLARTQWQLGDVEKAISSIDQATMIDPNNKQAFLLLASIYVSQQNPQAAIDVFEHVLMLDPQDTTASQGLQELKVVHP